MTDEPANTHKDNTTAETSEGFSSMQFFGIMQLAIFVPFLGPITTILLSLLNKDRPGTRSLLWGGIGMLILHIGALLTFLGMTSQG